jgi:hypothetical protein
MALSQLQSAQVGLWISPTACWCFSQQHTSSSWCLILIRDELAADWAAFAQLLSTCRTFTSVLIGSCENYTSLLFLLSLPRQHAEWSGQQETGLIPELLATTSPCPLGQKTDAVSVHMDSGNENSLWLHARKAKQAKLPFSFQKWQWNKGQEIHSADQHRKECQGIVPKVGRRWKER